METLEYSSDKELWVGETSSCYDGGAPQLSATYVAGFMQVQTIPPVEKQQRFFVDSLMFSVQLALSTKNLRCFSTVTATENDVTLTIPPFSKVESNVLCYRWLDKLGLAAIINHTRVMRQTFIGGSYGLLDIDGTPLPVCTRACNIQINTHFTIS